MRIWMPVAACILLAGCDYTVPLANLPVADPDPAVIGLWERTPGGSSTERLLVLPLNQKEYLVSFPAGSTNAMFARACIIRLAGKAAVQLTWIGTAQAGLPDDPRVYQFATFTVDGNTLSVRLLNADLVNRDVTSPAELEKAIANAKDHPALFRDAMVFHKVSGE